MSQTVLAPDAPANGHTARREATRRKLLGAGTELFAAQGVRAVTTTAIARRAGVATGTFYLHFPDKHALFEVLVQDALEEMGAQLRPDRLAPRGDDARRAGIEGMLEVAERRRDLIRAVFDRGEDSDLAQRIQDRIAEGLESAYERAFTERGIPLDPGAAAQARAAVLVRVIAWWVEDPERADRDQIVDTLLEFDPLFDKENPR